MSCCSSDCPRAPVCDRGRFDPLRRPWPPSRSTAHPGAHAEIVAEPAVSPKSAPSPALGPDGLELRRPSLSYLPPPMDNAYPLQSSQAPAPLQEGKRRSSGEASSSTDPWPGRAVFQSRTPPPTRRSGGLHRDAARLEPAKEAGHREGGSKHTSRASEAELMGAISPPQLASASTPNIGAALTLPHHLGPLTTSKRGSEVSQSVPVLNGDQILRQSVTRVASDGARQPDDTVWQPKAYQPTNQDAGTFSKTVARKSSDGSSGKESAHLSMGNLSSTLQPEGESGAISSLASSTDVSGRSSSTEMAGGRGGGKLAKIASGLLDDENARVDAAARGAAEAQSSETRPGPRPVQPTQLGSSNSEPSTWSSAPEGYLHSFNNTLASSQSGGWTSADLSVRGPHHAAGPSHALNAGAEGSTVAGMRRAAKRATSRRDNSSSGQMRQHELPPHSQSYHAGETRNLARDEDDGSELAAAAPQLSGVTEMRGAFSRSRSDSLRATSHPVRQASDADRWNEAAAEASACPMPGAIQSDALRSSANVSRRPSEVRRASGDFSAAAAVLAGQKASQAGSNAPYLHAYYNVGRRVEEFYRLNGYLPAIMPPNDVDRRGALRRYGPPRVSSDANFDRVAHLVKLVFNTKLVLVSLVGESSQHFRTQAGNVGPSRSPEWLQRCACSS